EEDRGAVLVAHVWALAVQRGRVMHVPERVEQLLVRHLRGVVRDFHRLGVASAAHAHLLVGGVVDDASLVTRDGLDDSRHLVEKMLDAPEAPAGESRFLHCSLQHSPTPDDSRSGRIRNRVLAASAVPSAARSPARERQARQAMNSGQIGVALLGATALFALWAAIFATRADRATRRATRLAGERWEASTKPVPHITFTDFASPGQSI